VLEHVEHDEQATSEVARVLCTDGVFALSVPAHPGWFGASDAWAGHVRRYTRRSLGALIDSTPGLDLVAMQIRSPLLPPGVD